MNAGDTITVQGEGGAVFDLDVPAAGTGPRELLDAQIADGRLLVLAETEPAPAVDPGAVPDGNITAVVDWVRGAPDGEDPTDGYQERAAQALEAEQNSAKPRGSLVDALTLIVGGS